MENIEIGDRVQLLSTGKISDDILGRFAKAYDTASGECLGVGFIASFPERFRESDKEEYMLVFNEPYLGHSICSFSEVGKDEQGIIIELEEE